jgi:ADP-ribose pyrophosphatase YjhB (NUDIX family)
MFTYCPKCKNKLNNEDYHYTCANCDFDFYFNASPAVSVILVNDKNQIYLGLRAREPKTGLWELPGGFINIKESAEDATIREIKEELGIELNKNKLDFYKSYPNEYLYKGTRYYPLDLFFIAKVDLNEINPIAPDELTEGQFFDIDKIPFDKLAFSSNYRVLQDYIKK